MKFLILSRTIKKEISRDFPQMQFVMRAVISRIVIFQSGEINLDIFQMKFR